MNLWKLRNTLHSFLVLQFVWNTTKSFCSILRCRVFIGWNDLIRADPELHLSVHRHHLMLVTAVILVLRWGVIVNMLNQGSVTPLLLKMLFYRICVWWLSLVKYDWIMFQTAPMCMCIYLHSVCHCAFSLAYIGILSQWDLWEIEAGSLLSSSSNKCICN